MTSSQEDITDGDTKHTHTLLHLRVCVESVVLAGVCETDGAEENHLANGTSEEI